jgi:SAM-dependent methyltransferase
VTLLPAAPRRLSVGDGAAARSVLPLAGHAEQVRSLFDSKAAGWPGKYAAGGRLTGRLTQLAAAVRAQVAAGGELLDLGCGSGDLARHLAAAGYRVSGCDISPRMLAQAAAADPEQTVRWVGLEPGWRALPFAPASLDAVVASSVLEYVPDPARVLAECARVLRPGGALLCTVPRVAHPVRWLEWPLGLAARTPAAGAAARGSQSAAQYLAYLQTSRQRHRAGWWRAAGRSAGLAARTGGPAGRETLLLLAFTRSASTDARPADKQTDILGD